MPGDFSLFSVSRDLVAIGLCFLLFSKVFFLAEWLCFNFLFSDDEVNLDFFLISFFDKVFTFFATVLFFLEITLDLTFDVFSSVLEVLESLLDFLELPLTVNLAFLPGGLCKDRSCSSEDPDDDDEDPESEDELEEEDDEEDDLFFTTAGRGGV